MSDPGSDPPAVTSWRLPTHVVLRSGSLDRLPTLLAAYEGQTVLLVHDEGLTATPWPELTARRMGDAGVRVEPFDRVEANPRHTTVNALGDIARRSEAAAVVALGGGSVLDAGKAAAMLATNPGGCEDFEGTNVFEHTPIPFVAIPTTCGTGSEVTWVSVVTRDDERRKMSIKGEAMFPSYALVDADLLATLPSRLVAWTGMDTLTHAVEAYTGTRTNPVSDALAESAVSLVFRYLPRAVQDIGGDAVARDAVARAATLAGMAFGNADVGGVHCLSETIGGMFDVPHGLANAILLAPVMRFHQLAADRALRRLHDAVFPSDVGRADAAGHLVERIEALAAAVGIPSFASLGVEPSAFPAIAAGSVRNNSNGSNPQPMTAGAYLQILQGLV